MKRNKKKIEIEILNHQKAILEIDLAKARRNEDEWRQAVQKLLAVLLRQRHISRAVRQVINNFPKY